jgi:hypothetical protein
MHWWIVPAIDRANRPPARPRAAALRPIRPGSLPGCLITEKKADDSGVSCPKGLALARPAAYAVLAEAQLRSTFVFPIGDPMKLPMMTAALVAAALATSPVLAQTPAAPAAPAAPAPAAPAAAAPAPDASAPADTMAPAKKTTKHHASHAHHKSTKKAAAPASEDAPK